MSKYRVTIEEYTGTNDHGYDNWKDIYQQTVVEVDIAAVVDVVNRYYRTEDEPVNLTEAEL